MKKSSFIVPRPYKSRNSLRFDTDSKHIRFRYVLQWRVTHDESWNTEQFEFYTDFVERVSWFRFHGDSFKIRTYAKCIALKAIDV